MSLRCFRPWVLGFVFLVGVRLAASEVPRQIQAGLASISSDGVLQHIRVLASDEFEGRAPGTTGEEKSISYLTDRFKALGLKPGNPDGSYIQDVPMVGITAQAKGSFGVGENQKELVFPSNCVIWSKHTVAEIGVTNSEVIFVGYGVVAPEYKWDDYKDADVRGKTILMLINDPQLPDPDDPTKLDERYFKGKAMTYYGRWTYKYEIAAEKGAAAAIIIHETGPAGYPWAVVEGSNSRENFDLESPDGNAGRVAVEGWITLEQARAWLASTRFDYEALKRAAAKRDFHPVALGSTASFAVHNTIRRVQSRNVIARLEGSDSRLRNQYVIYTAHWDHLGRDPKREGDQIYNGALDNASGCAGLLELAKAFTQLKPAPKRSILFLSVTAEEKGLLGSRYYASHPLYPLERTLANLNMDGLNPWGRTHDIEVIGIGNTTLEDWLAGFVAEQGRVVQADSEPEKGRFYRSDHFEFAKVGVPAIYAKGGIDYLGKGKEFGMKKSEEYTTKDYHKVSDEVKPGWDFSGAVEDLRLLMEVGWKAAEDARWPEWKPGTEFKARREAMLKAAGMNK